MRYRPDLIPEHYLESLPREIVSSTRANVGTVAKSGDKLADGVLSGYEWSGNSITYAFPDKPTDYNYKGEREHDFNNVNGSVRNAVMRVLDQKFGNTGNDGFSVEGFTNLEIHKGNDRNSDLRYAVSSEANPTAYAYYPTGGAVSGDVWFGTSATYKSPAVGNYAFATTLHETGHALGLKHGHQAVSFDRIKTTLEGKYDSLEYSVMTYHSYPGYKGNGYSNEPNSYPQTFMMADIRALQHMYGADFTTNSGDTVYKWNPSSGNTLVNGAVAINPTANRIFATIWDGGGDDTYDLSAYTGRLTLDLRPGESCFFKKGQLADLNQFLGGKNATGNIYNALQFKGDERSLIENAIGGSGNDILRGNAADNDLTGNGGNDVLTGNGGNDIFFFRSGGGSDRIIDFTSGDRINLASMGLSFGNIQALGTDSGGNFVIDFGNGDVLTLVGRTEASLQASDFIF